MRVEDDYPTYTFLCRTQLGLRSETLAASERDKEESETARDKVHP